jgi:hypothetical protein
MFGQKSKSKKWSADQALCISTIPDAGTQSASWLTWHKTLKRCLGKSGANAIWAEAWDSIGSKNPSAYSTSLAKYMQSQGVEIADDVGKKASLGLANFSGFFGGYFNFVKITGLVVGGGVAIAFLALLYNVIVNPEKAKASFGAISQGAMMATPQGRLASGVTKQLGQ